MTTAKIRPFENIALLLTTIPVAAWFSWQNRNYQLDDSLIYLRYIRNFFEGRGLTYNEGDYFNGLTSPLYSYFLIICNGITHNLQYTTIFLSFFFLCAAAIYGAFAFSDNKIEQAICGFSVASFNYFYTTFGMETTLFLFLSALILCLYKHERYYSLGIAIGLLILTRTEGIFLGAVVLLHYTIIHKKLPPVKYFIVPALVIIANLIFNSLYYGAPLPATGNAKIGQGRSGFWGSGFVFLQVEYMKNWFFGGNLKMLYFLIPAAAIGLWAKRTLVATHLFAAYLIILGCFYVFLLIPNYHWYYAPFFYFLTLFSAIGTFRVLAGIYRLAKKKTAYALAAVPVLIAASAFGTQSLKLSDISRGSVDSYKNIGNWITENTPKNSVVAAVEIGTIGWYADRYIIDILGLTNPYNADYIAKKDVHSWLTKYSPDYILVHEPLWVFETTANCLEHADAYKPVPNFQFPGYQLLAKSKSEGAAIRAAQCGQTG